jgi:hypothetical protein
MILADLNAVSLGSAAPGPASPHTLIVDHNARGFAAYGVDLETRAEAVTRATHEELVDPYRGVASTAAAGLSNVIALGAVSTAKTPTPSRPLTAAKSPRRSPEAKSVATGGDFLADWMAKRNAAAQRDSA